MENYIVYTNGSVDVEASVKNFRSKLESWLDNEQEKEAAYRQTVTDILRVSSSGSVPSSRLVGMVLVSLQVSVSDYEQAEKEVEAWLARNTGEKGSGTLLTAKKGKNGGIRLNSESSDEE